MNFLGTQSTIKKRKVNNAPRECVSFICLNLKKIIIIIKKKKSNF